MDKRNFNIAFTMAEILLSLTIIGVVAAITLPSLTGNINERTWETQRKAIYARLSQAIPLIGSMNGYGEYAGNWSDNTVTVTKDTAAMTFVTQGLAKVLKINNICDNQHFGDCGLPEQYTKLYGSVKVAFPKKLSEFMPFFNQSQSGFDDYINPQKHIDTSAVAFETANGESVALFYNPYCVDKTVIFSQPNSSDNIWFEPQSIYPYFCAAFLYDLNGKKGPNTMGKDIWAVAALYSADTSVVSIEPNKITNYFGPDLNFTQAVNFCTAQDARLPNIDEGIVMKFINTGIGWLSGDTGYADKAYVLTESGSLIKYSKTRSNVGGRCIKR